MVRPDRVEVFEATDGPRWRRKAPNGRVLSVSAEAFADRWKAAKAAERANRTTDGDGGVILDCLISGDPLRFI